MSCGHCHWPHWVPPQSHAAPPGTGSVRGAPALTSCRVVSSSHANVSEAMHSVGTFYQSSLARGCLRPSCCRFVLTSSGGKRKFLGLPCSPLAQANRCVTAHATAHLLAELPQKLCWRKGLVRLSVFWYIVCAGHLQKHESATFQHDHISCNMQCQGKGAKVEACASRVACGRLRRTQLNHWGERHRIPCCQAEARKDAECSFGVASAESSQVMTIMTEHDYEGSNTMWSRISAFFHLLRTLPKLSPQALSGRLNWRPGLPGPQRGCQDGSADH